MELRRQLFRLSALLELADKEFLTLREDTKSILQLYKEEIFRGDLEIPLNLDSLGEFLKQKVDLKPWYNIGLEAGMEPSPTLIDVVDTSGSLRRLLLTLQAINISTIAEFADMLPKLQNTSRKSISQFVSDVRSNKREFWPVSTDIMTVLVSLLAAKQFPKDFSWGGSFYVPIEKALRSACGLPPRPVKTSKPPRRKRTKQI
jgi:GTP pyrophosphokinase